MWVMAISTEDQFLADRMAERPISFSPDILMAAITDFLFLHFRCSVVYMMHGVATGAGHIIGIVKTALPMFDICLVTTQAYSIAFFSGNIGIFTKCNQTGGIDFSGHIEVVTTWAMADFTAILAGAWSSRVGFLPVLVLW
jgi:hypothetical protein